MKVFKLRAKGFGDEPVKELGGAIVADGAEFFVEAVFGERLIVCFGPRLTKLEEQDLEMDGKMFKGLDVKTEPKPDPIAEPDEGEPDETTKHNKGLFGRNKKRTGVSEK